MSFKKCSLCNKIHFAKGYCRLHYRQAFKEILNAKARIWRKNPKQMKKALAYNKKYRKLNKEKLNRIQRIKYIKKNQANPNYKSMKQQKEDRIQDYINTKTKIPKLRLVENTQEKYPAFKGKGIASIDCFNSVWHPNKQKLFCSSINDYPNKYYSCERFERKVIIQ